MGKARTFLRYPGGLAKALTLSYDDGVYQDKRMIEILDKYGIKLYLYINEPRSMPLPFFENTPKFSDT